MTESQLPAVQFSGIDGFLPGRASLMLDVVFLAMFLVVPVLLYAVYQVRVRRNFRLHKRVMLTLASVLLVTVGLFELDVRLNGWRERAMASPYYGGEDGGGALFTVLYVHLFFSITTTVLWCVVVVRALRRFSSPPAPGEHSRSHIFWARIATIDMVLTALTGNTFYWMAFLA